MTRRSLAENALLCQHLIVPQRRVADSASGMFLPLVPVLGAADVVELPRWFLCLWTRRRRGYRPVVVYLEARLAEERYGRGG